jgi:hypothetical protein
MRPINHFSIKTLPPAHYIVNLPFRSKVLAGCRWLMPVILAIQEAEIRKISV